MLSFFKLILKLIAGFLRKNRIANITKKNDSSDIPALPLLR